MGARQGVGGSSEEAAAARGEGDVEESIVEARYYMRLFQEMGSVSMSTADEQIGQAWAR